MSQNFIPQTDDLFTFLRSMGMRESEDLKRHRQVFADHPQQQMQVSPEIGQLLKFLVYLTQSQSIIEVGTFLGYSASAMAEALPASGQLHTIDCNNHTTNLAREFSETSLHGHKIIYHLGNALDTLQSDPFKNYFQTTLCDSEESFFDLCFIDADKNAYLHYFEALLPFVREGGLIIFDNTLWRGEVVSSDPRDKRAQTLRKFLETLKEDPRIQPLTLPLSDGITLCIKKKTLP